MINPILVRITPTCAVKYPQFEIYKTKTAVNESNDLKLFHFPVRQTSAVCNVTGVSQTRWN